MVHLTKTPLPPNVTINSEHSYRQGEAFDILIDDCHGKCYICEDEEIARSSIYAAFKRKIIRDDPELSVIFADALK